MPSTSRDGRAEWEITAPQHRLSELGTQLEGFGIPFTVNEVRRRVEPESLLTDRQLALVHAAVERGYYDPPRRCSLTELAADVGLAKSTCSETLHRVEGRIVERFLEDVDSATIESIGSRDGTRHLRGPHLASAYLRSLPRDRAGQESLAESPRAPLDRTRERTGEHVRWRSRPPGIGGAEQTGAERITA
jgi:hypothetical protein